MKTVKDYHIHSTYSKNQHGKSTIEEIAQRAAELELKEIAVTDHGPSHFLYGIEKNKIFEAKEKVIKMRKKYPKVKILMGVEANILSYSGDTDICDEVSKNCDIILCGYHSGVLFSSFKDVWGFYVMNFLCRFSSGLKVKQARKNSEAVCKAMNRYHINIITHPGDKIPMDIGIIAASAAETNTLLEINNSHGHMNAEEIKTAAEYDIKFVIGSDAHIKNNIGNYENALKAAVDAGIDLNRIVNLQIE